MLWEKERGGTQNNSSFVLQETMSKKYTYSRPIAKSNKDELRVTWALETKSRLTAILSLSAPYVVLIISRSGN